MSWFLGLSMIGLTLASMGCSGGDPVRPPDDDDDDGATSSSSSGTGGSGSGSGGGQGGQGGSGGQGGEGGAGGQGGSGDLVPLAVGYHWTYAIEILGTEDDCGGNNETTVLKATTLEGKNGFDVAHFCSMPLVLRSEGDFVEYNQGNGWTTLLEPPVEDGHVWSCFGAATCTWKSAGTVTVPAGTFSNCWTAVVDFMDGQVREKTYCRGVGQVTSHNERPDGNGYDAKLVSKSF